MITNQSVISDVRSALKLNHFDVELPTRAIYSKILDVRNKYVKQQTDKRKLWESDNIFTTLKIELEEVPILDVCDYQGNCMVARSKVKLPKIMDSGVFGLIHAGITTLEGKRRFKEITPNLVNTMKELQLPGSNIYYWFFNGYLVIDSPTIETVIFRAFLDEDDYDSSMSMDCDEDFNCPINPLEKEFKCPGYLKDDIVRDVVAYYLGSYKRSIQDPASDGVDQTK